MRHKWEKMINHKYCHAFVCKNCGIKKDVSIIGVTKYVYKSGAFCYTAPPCDGQPLICEGCGKQDETVKDKGFKLCPKCDEQLADSFEARMSRDWNEEYDGGGGA